MQTIIESIDYNQAPEALKYEIGAMLYKVWPDNSSMPGRVLPDVHEKELNAHSFYSYLNGKLVSYAGVVRKTIEIGEHKFNLAGLSCVATDPEYRNQGFASKTVAAATQWIERQKDIDFGVFTCDPSLSAFYYQAGAWEVIPDVVLIGNEEKDALSSESLNVVVLMRLFSKKALKYESILRHTTINIQFPEGQFL